MSYEQPVVLQGTLAEAGEPTSVGVPTQVTPPESEYSPDIAKVKDKVIAESHELANLFPIESEKSLREMAESMKARGQRHKTVMYKGKIVDGRNREIARQLAGLPPAHMDFAEVGGKASLEEFIIDENINRRHLDVGQRALIAGKLVPHMKVEAKKRRGQRNDLKPGNSGDHGRATKLAGEKVGISADSAGKGVVVAEHGCHALQEALKNGTISLSAAEKIARQPEQEQPQLLAEALSKKTSKKKRTTRSGSSTDTEEPEQGSETAAPEQAPPPDVSAIAAALLTLSTVARDYDTPTKRESLVKALKAEPKVGKLVAHWTAVFDFSEKMIPASRQCSTK
jgi:hypothetical protein